MIHRRLLIYMLILFATSRARSQPVDAGVPDAPAPSTPPSPPPSSGATTEEPPQIIAPGAADLPGRAEGPAEADRRRRSRRGRRGGQACRLARDLQPRESAVRRPRDRGRDTWTFEPAKKDGQPVASHLDVTVHFDPSGTPGGETITVHGKLNATRARSRSAPKRRCAGRPRRTPASSRPRSRTRTRPSCSAGRPASCSPTRAAKATPSRSSCAGSTRARARTSRCASTATSSTRSATCTATATPTCTSSFPSWSQSLRVLEGPFDPRQGNFAVAGSADYELGLTRARPAPRATRSARSAPSARSLLWGPPGEQRAHLRRRRALPDRRLRPEPRRAPRDRARSGRGPARRRRRCGG